MTHTVFIDGEIGTTGLLIRDRLLKRADLRLIQLDDARRKDKAARRDALNSADVAILCLPDTAAVEAVGLVDNDHTVIIDASTAHRVRDGWTYGFPEMTPGQRDQLKASKRISNPGCHATGFIALLRPLVDAGIIPAYFPITATSLTGYSGGGKAMIAEFESPVDQGGIQSTCRLYATGLSHKHLPEMTSFTGLAGPPVFAPTVGRFAQGMLVQVPLHLWALPDEPDLEAIHAILARAYDGEAFIEVVSLIEAEKTAMLDPELCNHSNRMRLYIFGNAETGQANLAAVFDNLGKGASGTAVQNLNLVLGLDEGAGLS